MTTPIDTRPNSLDAIEAHGERCGLILTRSMIKIEGPINQPALAILKLGFLKGIEDAFDQAADELAAIGQQ